MKTTNRKSDALSEMLHTWRTTAPVPPDFRDSVWRRIAQEEAKPNLSFFASLSAWMETVLPRPKFALSYVAALLLVGMTSGLWVAQNQSHRITGELSSRYVQSVDPYLAIASNR
jgi:hypothetical protein